MQTQLAYGDLRTQRPELMRSSQDERLYIPSLVYLAEGWPTGFGRRGGFGIDEGFDGLFTSAAQTAVAAALGSGGQLPAVHFEEVAWSAYWVG